MPIQLVGVLLPTVSDSELSRVRTELEGRRVLAAIPPHPIQASSQPSSHRYLGNAPLPAYGQVSIAAPPVRVTTYGGLCCLPQQLS